MQVKVRVVPKARKERFEKISEREFKAEVKEPAQHNLANTKVQRLVADYFNLPVTSVRFLTGMRGKTKTFEIVQ